MILVFAICVGLPFFIHLFFNDGAPRGISRLGRAGVIGYIVTAIRFTFQRQRLLDEGDKKFGGRPFAVPTLNGWLIILNAEHVETLRMSDDTVFNQPILIHEGLQLDYTMDPYQTRFPFHIEVVRNEVTRGIAALIPEIMEETSLVMEEAFKVPPGADYASLPLFPSITHMVGRVSNRAVLGQELCRNEDFIRAVVRFSRTLVIYARILRLFPTSLRRFLYFGMSSIWGGSKQPKAFVNTGGKWNLTSS